MDDGLTKPPRDRWQRLSLIVMAAGGISLLAAIVLLVLTLTGVINKNYEGPGPTTVFGPTLISRWLTPEATPTQPLPTPSEAPIANLVIPRFDIDAPVVVRGVDANHVMETPSGPKDVAWYDFSAKPGYGSNAVFSGHVDYIGVGAAVFWHLKDLNEGDLIEVHLDDGTVYTYKVASREEVPADPPQDVLTAIIGPTQQDVVTLITCGGTFDYSTHQYDHRVVVRAERVLDTAPGQAAGAAAPSS
jgi:LPXTG-site transpeptidase (sortase) family protein